MMRIKGSYVFGVCDGCDDVTPSDTVNLPHNGFFEARGAAGNIKFTDVKNAVKTKSFALNELSKFRVKKIWADGTTATGIVIYYY